MTTERSDSKWRTAPRLRQTRTILLNAGHAEEKRSEIRQYFHDTYDIDESLFEILKYDETFYRRADPLRHPLIFYFGHTAALYVNKLLLARLIEARVNSTYESMFAVGVDEMSWDDLNEKHYDWPSVADVQAYRDRVRAVVDDVIQTMPLQLPITWDSPWWVIMMGIEHARIHLETSSVLIRQLPIEHVRSHPLWQVCRQSGTAPENELVDVPAGRVELGKTERPSTLWMGQRVRHPCREHQGLSGKPIPCQQSRVPGVCRGFRIHNAAVVDRRRVEVARVQASHTSAILDSSRRVVQTTDRR